MPDLSLTLFGAPIRIDLGGSEVGTLQDMNELFRNLGRQCKRCSRTVAKVQVLSVSLDYLFHKFLSDDRVARGPASACRRDLATPKLRVKPRLMTQATPWLVWTWTLATSVVSIRGLPPAGVTKVKSRASLTSRHGHLHGYHAQSHTDLAASHRYFRDLSGTGATHVERIREGKYSTTCRAWRESVPFLS